VQTNRSNQRTDPINQPIKPTVPANEPIQCMRANHKPTDQTNKPMQLTDPTITDPSGNKPIPCMRVPYQSTNEPPHQPKAITRTPNKCKYELHCFIDKCRQLARAVIDIHCMIAHEIRSHTHKPTDPTSHGEQTHQPTDLTYTEPALDSRYCHKCEHCFSVHLQCRLMH
jgi:hypothetical protein